MGGAGCLARWRFRSWRHASCWCRWSRCYARVMMSCWCAAWTRARRKCRSLIRSCSTLNARTSHPGLPLTHPRLARSPLFGTHTRLCGPKTWERRGAPDGDGDRLGPNLFPPSAFVISSPPACLGSTSNGLSTTASGRPELLVELPRPLTEMRGEAVGQRPRHRRTDHPTEKHLAILGLDRFMALGAGTPLPHLCGIAPACKPVTTEIAVHRINRIWPSADAPPMNPALPRPGRLEGSSGSVRDDNSAMFA